MTINQETPQDVMKSPVDFQALTAENEAPKKMELVLASLTVPIKAVPPPSQGFEASDTASVGKFGFVSHTKHTAEAIYMDLFHS